MADNKQYPTDADEDPAQVAAEIEKERAFREMLGIAPGGDGEHLTPGEEDIPEGEPAA